MYKHKSVDKQDSKCYYSNSGYIGPCSTCTISSKAILEFGGYLSTGLSGWCVLGCDTIEIPPDIPSLHVLLISKH